MKNSFINFFLNKFFDIENEKKKKYKVIIGVYLSVLFFFYYNNFIGGIGLLVYKDSLFMG